MLVCFERTLKKKNSTSCYKMENMRIKHRILLLKFGIK